MKTIKLKQNKYNLAGIKRAGEECAYYDEGSFTCLQLETQAFIAECKLHREIFAIEDHMTFMGMWMNCDENLETPTSEQVKSLRLMALAMTHEIARQINNGENLLDII